MRKARHNLTARERFLVTNYIIDHVDELREMRTHVARCKHVSEVFGFADMSVANLLTAADAANLPLSVPRKRGAPGSKTTSELLERIDALEADALELRDCVASSDNWIRYLSSLCEGLSDRLDAIDGTDEQA